MILTITGWVLFAGTLYCLAKSNSLPLKTRIWLKKIGKETIEKFSEDAKHYVPADSPDSIKRFFVLHEIQDYVNETFDTEISDSDCNLIIEYLYNKTKNYNANTPLLQKIKSTIIAIFELIVTRTPKKQ